VWRIVRATIGKYPNLGPSYFSTFASVLIGFGAPQSALPNHILQSVAGEKSP
jgi:hypothetical protein